MNEYVKNINRIEFVVTMACTGKCKHCSEGDHTNCSGHIDADVAVKAVRDLCANYKIQSLMTFGGEPLLYPDVVCAIHNTAAEMGIPQRDLITNGYFSKNPNKIKSVVQMLKESGITRILLSVDAFHQETIPLEPVKEFASCVKEAGMNLYLSPAWLVSQEDSNPYNEKTKAVIKEFDEFQIPMGSGNVIFPSGNALQYLKEYFADPIDYSNPYEEDPRDIRTADISENGDVLGGNLYQTGILDILKAYQP